MDKETAQEIQMKLADNKTVEAIDQLLGQNISGAWKETVLVLKANFLNVEQQVMQGVISHADAQLQFNRINSAALKTLTHLESGTGDAEKILAGFKDEFAVQNKVENTTQISGSNINIENSDGVVIGSGNTVKNRFIMGMGKKQFIAIIILLFVIIAFGAWAGQKLFAQQEEHFHSLEAIKSELAALSISNKKVKQNLDEKGSELDDLLKNGTQAMKVEDYETAIQLFEKAARELPSATLYQNLSIAYDGIGQEAKSNQYLEKAEKINPDIKLPVSYTALKGKRINLLLKKNGGEILSASHKNFAGLMDTRLYTISVNNGDELVVGFLNNRPATFDMFTVYINETRQLNLKDFELFYSNDSPGGPFTSLGTFTAENKFLGQTPFQEFKFKPVTAKYFKFKSISPHGERYNYCYTAEFQLWGTYE
ncbi:MAG: hypothetical protein AAFZ15_13425 [Bacteroidota bacterium]